METEPRPPSKPKPDGTWRRCPACGATGTNNRQIGYGNDKQFELVTCRKCNGMGWLVAPWYYDKPVREWPDGATL